MESNTVATAFDLFAGAGGLSTGLETAGFSVLYANEVESVYAETLRRNHPETLVDVQDIRLVDANDVLERVNIKPGDLDLLAGGPPCQGFSINAPIRSTADDRNHLFWRYLHFVEVARPKFILIENVPGIVSFEGGDVVRSILQSLRKLGYDCDVKILYAAQYGIPQSRWRTIIIGNRVGVASGSVFPPPTHVASGRANFTQRLDGRIIVMQSAPALKQMLRPAATVWDALSDLPAIGNGSGAERNTYATAPATEYQEMMRRSAGDFLFNHQCAGLGAANLVRLPFIPMGGSWRDIPYDLLPTGMKRARKSDHTKRYGRLHPDGICSTILTKCDPHWGSFIHPHQDRVLSVREAARIQSFPDRVRFFGNLSQQYEQVGNAVPPVFASVIGCRILDAIHGVSFDSEQIQTSLRWGTV